VATPERLAPSRRLRTAATAERERLSRDLARLDDRASALQRELADLETKRSELRDQLSLLARLTVGPDESPFLASRTPGRAGHLREIDESPATKAVLAGARIREVAVLLLASSANPTRPIHYQQWYRLFRDAGYGIDARDPVATFLTQISRSPAVRRADAPGVYALDFDASRALRARLGTLETRLATLTTAESPEELAVARKNRANLLRDIRATERDLEEALRSLGSGTEPS
jgi:hypothetical protein